MKTASARGLLAVAVAAAVVANGEPDCLWTYCPKCLPDLELVPRKLKIMGPDGLFHLAPFRIGHLLEQWDSKAAAAHILGTLIKERLGYEVEYVECFDEVACYLAVNGCVGYNEHRCDTVQNSTGSHRMYTEGRKLFNDPLSDIMFVPEVTRDATTRDNFKGAGATVEYDCRPGMTMGATGYTTSDQLWVRREVAARAWAKDRIDLLSIRGLANLSMVNTTHLNTPWVLMNNALPVMPSTPRCLGANDIEDFAMQQLVKLNWQCRDGWWLTPACANTSDITSNNWQRECFVVVENSWNFPKPDLFRALANSGAKAAMVTVGYTKWQELVERSSYNVTFTWWSPDATFGGNRLLQVNFGGPTAPLPKVALKAAWRPAIQTHPQLARLLWNSYFTPAAMQELMDGMTAARVAGYSTLINKATFYEKLACDWIRSHKDVWSEWFPSDGACPASWDYEGALESALPDPAEAANDTNCSNGSNGSNGTCNGSNASNVTTQALRITYTIDFEVTTTTASTTSTTTPPPPAPAPSTPAPTPSTSAEASPLGFLGMLMEGKYALEGGGSPQGSVAPDGHHDKAALGISSRDLVLLGIGALVGGSVTVALAFVSRARGQRDRSPAPVRSHSRPWLGNGEEAAALHGEATE